MLILAEEEVGRASWGGRLPTPWVWHPAVPPLAKQAGGEAPGPQAGEQEGKQDGLCDGSGSWCLVEVGGLSVTGARRQRGTGLRAPRAWPVPTIPREPQGHLSRRGSYSTSSRCWDLVCVSRQAEY